MKSIVLTFAAIQVLCFFACESNSSPPAQTSAKVNSLSVELLQTEKARLDAINQLDTTSFKKWLDPEFELIDDYGQLKTISDLMQQFKIKANAGVREKHYTKSSQVKLIDNQNTALIKGIYIIEKLEKKGIMVLNMRYCDVYLKENQQWRLLSSQFTRVRNLKL